MSTEKARQLGYWVIKLAVRAIRNPLPRPACPAENGNPCRHYCQPGKCNERAKKQLLNLLPRD